MAARVIDIKGSRFIGTLSKLLALAEMIGDAKGASVIDAKNCEFVILDGPVGQADYQAQVDRITAALAGKRVKK